MNTTAIALFNMLALIFPVMAIEPPGRVAIPNANKNIAYNGDHCLLKFLKHTVYFLLSRLP